MRRYSGAVVRSAIREAADVRRAYALAVLSIGFGAIVAALIAAVTIPVTLYVPLSGPARHVNVPQIAVVPLLAGIAIGVLESIVDGDIVGIAAVARGVVSACSRRSTRASWALS